MPGIFVATLSVLCYSFSYVFLHKGQVDSNIEDNGLLGVLFFGFVGLGVGAAFILQPHGYNILSQFTSRDQLVGYGFAALSGIIGTLFGRLTVYAAIKRLGAARGIVVGSSEILVTLVLAVLILHEKLHVTDTAGVGLLVLGIGLLILERLVVQDRSTVKQGVLFGIVGALLQGSGHFVRKLGMTSSIIPVIAATLDLLVALTLYLILLLVLGRLRRYLEHYRKALNVYIIAAGFCSAAGVLLFFVAVQTAPVWKVAMIIGMQPMLVTVISTLLFRDLERITWMTGVYTFLVTIGIAVLQMR